MIRYEAYHFPNLLYLMEIYMKKNKATERLEYSLISQVLIMLVKF